MAFEPPEIRPDDLPPIEDARTYEIVKRLLEKLVADFAAEFPGEELPGFAQRFVTSLRWRLREWENRA